MNNAFAATQKRCSKQFKRGILRTGYVNLAGKCVITPNYDDLFRHRNHPSSVVVCSTFQWFYYTKKPAGLTRRASCLRDRFAREKFPFGLRGSLVPRNSASFCSCRCASKDFVAIRSFHVSSFGDEARSAAAGFKPWSARLARSEELAPAGNYSPRAKRTKLTTLMVPPSCLAAASVYCWMVWSEFLTNSCSVRQFSL